MQSTTNASLYIVSTPIGNINDFTIRGIDILRTVDVILCEDTRITSKLLMKYSINKSLVVYNDHNVETIIPKVINNILNHNTVYALVSDAGTPLISDPGYKLINACIQNDIKYTSVPGACAAINALVLSGLPSDRFLFIGFFDNKKLDSISDLNSTIIMYESPNRIISTLEYIKSNDKFTDSTIVVIREMTKIFEEVIRGDVDYLIEHFNANRPRGEFVILLAPKENLLNNNETILSNYLDLINLLIDKISLKDISIIISKYTKINKNTVYNFTKNLNNKTHAQ
ncbi:MAG: 16S rRNA (cytidine(1402)-2'-O)-methyltransferase [Alphaproteobacteria bacterium]|nr:16S rRNA (cytidine(1402)-2'-O)-methyltransferase [Alphaproteobacteria bacterium]